MNVEVNTDEVARGGAEFSLLAGRYEWAVDILNDARCSLATEALNGSEIARTWTMHSVQIHQILAACAQNLEDCGAALETIARDYSTTDEENAHKIIASYGDSIRGDEYPLPACPKEED